ARARTAAPANRRLPLLLRADTRAEVAPVPDSARAPQEIRVPLPRLGHPRPDAGGARLRPPRRRPGRRLVRRASLGARRRDDPARDRPAPVHARATVRSSAADRCPRALEPREEG